MRIFCFIHFIKFILIVFLYSSGLNILFYAVRLLLLTPPNYIIKMNSLGHNNLPSDSLTLLLLQVSTLYVTDVCQCCKVGTHIGFKNVLTGNRSRAGTGLWGLRLMFYTVMFISVLKWEFTFLAATYFNSKYSQSALTIGPCVVLKNSHTHFRIDTQCLEILMI